jgi:four helix bundle protein
MSMDLVESVYVVTELLPRDERFGLVSQLRRSAVGIPSNVSEGHQQGARAYRRYVTIALGCLAECETQLELARRLKLAPDEKLRAVLDQAKPVGRVLQGLRRSLRDR